LLPINIKVILVIIFVAKPRTITPVGLPGAEVNNYKGERLTAIDDTPTLGIKGVQKIDVSNYKLFIVGLVYKNIDYTYDEVISKHQSYTKVVTLNCVEGFSTKILWEVGPCKQIAERCGNI
jgi:DMSO/TMAO reductase YedYZ molybdopterin-dependent catalytic subunit